MLYDVSNDPNELENLSGMPEHSEIESELRSMVFQDWNPDELYETIRASQKRRLAVHKFTDGDPTYVNIVRSGDESRFVRNSGAADAKAKARFPFVETSSPEGH